MKISSFEPAITAEPFKNTVKSPVRRPENPEIQTPFPILYKLPEGFHYFLTLKSTSRSPDNVSMPDRKWCPLHCMKNYPLEHTNTIKTLQNGGESRVTVSQNPKNGGPHLLPWGRRWGPPFWHFRRFGA